MKRVLVTGSTGFVGRAVLPLLLERGFDVHAVGRTAPVGHRLTFHVADLLSPAQTSAVLATIRPSHLLHLAWYAEPGVYWTSAKNLEWVSASLNLVRSFAEAGGRRAVIAGTCAEYAWGSARFHETQSPCVPATLYGAAKDGLRRILEAYAATCGLSLAWGRIFYLYGPDERPGRLVSDAIRKLLAGERFPTSEGLQKRDFLHIADAAAAFAALLDSPAEGPVNIGSGQAQSVRRLLEHIAFETGRPDLIGFGERPLSASEPHAIEADVQRLGDEVGFTPRYDLNHGLAETVNWWRTQRRPEE
ncbi:NAD(P)-dependent oxidoreductase [Beijerinckia sp. L45]|uniref:NAD-dependent epimerase/dehydratase family protein n=1 Tax=Beijerinckia sp. L45 TaxID=1641855 RepID=UPI00131BDD96|nr:NAD(P)-dependent oxidoreductase [Beijerinckia sp. L45]